MVSPTQVVNHPLTHLLTNATVDLLVPICHVAHRLDGYPSADRFSPAAWDVI